MDRCGPIQLTMSSDAGLTLLREIERRKDLAGLLAACLTDLRDPGKANLIKILWWDGTGLCLFSKRLDSAGVPWPSN